MIKVLAICLFTASLLGVFTSIDSTPPLESDGAQREANDTEALTLFENRIMPIFDSPDPSSCVQCHLSSVDLKNYILPSHEKTFLSLRDQGLIDVDNPKRSKILKLIEMGQADSDERSRLIHAKMRQAEYEAFVAWIQASCQDEKLRSLPPLDKSELAGPSSPNEVIRHSRKSRLIDSFTRHVWSQRMRCFPCHTQHEIGPRQKVAIKKFSKWHEEYGDKMLIFKKSPEATLRYLIEHSEATDSDHLPLLNLDDPTKSLLVLKPTSKIPPKKNGQRSATTYAEPVYHMGGLKMHLDDHSYKAFVAWIEDYTNVTKGRYTSIEDLPSDNWHPTKRVLRMRDVPESWKVGTAVQVFVHRMKPGQSEGSEQAVAFTQGTITPRKIVNGPLILLAPLGSTEYKKWKSQHNRLPPGKYLVKVYVDTAGKLQDDPALLLGSSDYVGQITIENARWRVGFPKATWISAKDLLK